MTRCLIVTSAGANVTLLEHYDGFTACIRKTRNNLSGNCASRDGARPLRMRAGPNTFLKTVESELTFSENAVAYGEAAATPFADFALDDNVIIEMARVVRSNRQPVLVSKIMRYCG